MGGIAHFLYTVLCFPQRFFCRLHVDKHQLAARLQDSYHLGKRLLYIWKMMKRQPGKDNIKAAIQKRQLRRIAEHKGYVVKMVFAASAFPTDSIAGVISRQTTFLAYGAIVRPQAQVPAATSKRHRSLTEQSFVPQNTNSPALKSSCAYFQILRLAG